MLLHTSEKSSRETAPAELEAPALTEGRDFQNTRVTTNGDHKEASQENAEFPEGGTRAWLVAGGGAVIFFCTLGFANSFGVFEEYYLTHQLQGHSPSRVAWIGSLQSFLQFFAGMLGGPLFDRYGGKIIQPSAVLYVCSVMMLSLCSTYWQIMLVQGVLMGFVMGLLQFPAFAAVSQYFHKNRAAALGLVVSGSSIGGIVMPITLSKMINGSSLGFAWSVRIIGFLILPFMAFACLAIKARLPPRTTSFWMLPAFKEVRFVILVIALFFKFVGMLTPLFYLPTYATTLGMDATLAGYLLAIINAASTFGRVIPGVLADRYGRLNTFAIGGVSTGIIVFCMNTAHNNAGLIVYAIFFGFAQGTIISGGAAAFSNCPKDARDVGTYMGMGMALAGIGALAGPPVNGAFVATYGGFFEVAIFSGSMLLFGGFIAFAAKLTTPEGILGRA